jgi:hypothetical protein
VIKLDVELLKRAQLAELPPAFVNVILRSTYEELEMRVGARLAARMSDAQFDEFETFIDNDDDSGALAWLEANFPDYREIVAAEFDRLVDELGAVSQEVRDMAFALLPPSDSHARALW